MLTLGIVSLLIPLALGNESHLKNLVRSECLVITNSPSWIHDGPLIRIEDPHALQGWDHSMGITSGTTCLDIVYFGPWDIAGLEPWKGLYLDYSIISVMGPEEDLRPPSIAVSVKFLDQGWIHLYCPNHGWQFNVTLFGGPENKQLRPIPKCPTSLANQHFNISSIGFSPPDVVFNDEGEIVGGTALDVFNIMAEKYHFNYTIKTEFAWGQPIGENGEWNGLIGNVKNGTSAFGVGIIFMDYDYSKAVDYLDTLVFYPIILRSKKPSKLPAYSNLLRPFSLLVWLMILAVVPAFIIVFITFKRSEGITKGSELASHGFMVVRILFGQSGNLTTHNERSSKIFFGFWIMVVLFLSSMYECNLRAYLMHTSYEKPIETEKDILDRGRDLYLPVRTPFDAYYRDSELDLRRQLWAKVEKNPNLLFYSGIASCVLQHEETNLLEKGGVDLLSPVIFFARYPIMKEKFGYEPFYISKKAVFELQFSMMLKKHQDHRQDLNWVVRQLQAAGIVDHLSQDYLSQEAVIGESLDNRPKAFTFEHFAGAFVILTIGLILSFSMFLYESLSPIE